MKSRQTRQKEQLQEVIDSYKEFFSAEDILVNNPYFSKATVYRFLKQAVKEGELTPYTCGGKTIYSQTKKVHCHFYCEETQQTKHFTIESLNFLKDKIPGQIRSVQIEVRGTCKDCSHS